MFHLRPLNSRKDHTLVCSLTALITSQTTRAILVTTSLVLFIAWSGSIGNAQEPESDTRAEVWPEIGLYVPLNEKFRLFFLVTVSKARETRDNLEGQVGAHIDYKINKKLSFRTGYRYGFSLSETDPFTEHRLITEQTFRQPLPWKILLSDRNRQDYRFVNDDFSFRYRNRITLEREVRLLKRNLTPYASAEIFYDSRFDTWNRHRLTAGVQVPLRRGLPLITLADPRRQLVLDLSYTRQSDSRSQPHRVHAVGASLTVYF